MFADSLFQQGARKHVTKAERERERESTRIFVTAFVVATFRRAGYAATESDQTSD